jgi:hypothetical protein
MRSRNNNMREIVRLGITCDSVDRISRRYRHRSTAQFFGKPLTFSEILSVGLLELLRMRRLDMEDCPGRMEPVSEPAGVSHERG